MEVESLSTIIKGSICKNSQLTNSGNQTNLKSQSFSIWRVGNESQKTAFLQIGPLRQRAHLHDITSGLDAYAVYTVKSEVINWKPPRHKDWGWIFLWGS